MSLTPQQLEKRRNYLGASDLPKILGIHPHGNANKVYWEKMAPELQDTPTPSTQIGDWMEPMLVRWLAENYQVDQDKGRDVSASLAVYADGKTKGRIIAHPDAAIRLIDANEGVEAKWVGPANAEDWGDPDDPAGVPEYVQVQAQGQMYVWDFRLVWVPIAILTYGAYAPERRLYKVNRDQSVIDALTAYSDSWWQRHVVAHVPPDPCEPPPMAVLKAIQRDPGKAIDVTDENDAQLFYNWHDQQQEVAEAAKIKDKLLNRAIDKLDDATFANLPDGRQFTYREQNGSRKCNLDQLKLKFPDAYDATVTRSRHRVARMKKAIEG